MKRSLLVVGVAALFAGCGGGGARSVPAAGVPTAVPTAAPGKAASAHFTITIPAPPSGTAGRRRRPDYISSATNSLTVAVSGGATTVIPLTPTSPGCSTSNGARTCAVDLQLPAGNDVFTVSTFASADGSGTPLSTVTMTQTIVANQTNPVSLTLNGVVQSLATTVNPSSFTTGQAGSATVVVSALDPAGQTIVIPPGVLVDHGGNPVTIGLADSDTSGATHLSSNTVGSAPVTLSYNGASPAPSNVTITATATSSAGTVATAPGKAVSFMAPQSLYVLNGADNTIVEYPLPLPTGTATPAPRRLFGGASIGCAGNVPAPGTPAYPEYFGVDALTVDPSGNAFAASDTLICGSSSVYAFSPNAGPTTAPYLTFAEDANENSPSEPTIAFDASRHLIDTSDNGTLTTPPNGVANGFNTAISFANQFSQTGTEQTQIYSTNNCFVQDASFACPPVQATSSPEPAPFLLLGAHVAPQPIALDANADLVMSAEDRRGPFYLGTNGATYGPPAIVLVPPGSQTSGGPIVTAPSWIEGPHTGLSSPLSFAVDENDVLYVLDGEQGEFNPTYPGNPGYCSAAPQPDAALPASSCSDGLPHYYLLAFDLKALCGTPGPCDLQPLFILGGGSVARFAFANNASGNFPTSSSGTDIILGGNMLSAAYGFVAVANPTGPTCDAACQSGQYGSSGEVDVYKISGVTGAHFDDAQSAPVTVLPAAQYLNAPAAVALGPSGSATAGIAGIRRMPATHGRHPLHRRFRTR